MRQPDSGTTQLSQLSRYRRPTTTYTNTPGTHTKIRPRETQAQSTYRITRQGRDRKGRKRSREHQEPVRAPRARPEGGLQYTTRVHEKRCPLHFPVVPLTTRPRARTKFVSSFYFLVFPLQFNASSACTRPGSRTLSRASRRGAFLGR
jgi:hypothetical protein